MFFSLPGLLISGKDPQGLTNITTNFSSFIHIGLLKYIFVGIGEELFNFYILLTLISFIRGKNRLILSVLITCLIFGLLHGINWPILSAFFIAFGHIPYIYSYGKYKSLLPAMLAHVINNMLVAMTLIPGIESLVNFTIQITFFVFVFGFWNKAKAI
jgi:membrane protease YdiL (CAAX protease family)